MLLFNTNIEGANYQIRPLAGQSELKKKSKYELPEISVAGPIAKCAKFPLGTVFIALDYDIPDGDLISIRENELIPMVYNDSVFPLNDVDSSKIDEMSTTLLNYMLNNSDTYDNEDTIKKIGEQLASYGYAFDWDALTSMDLSDGVPSGDSLKRSILSKFPVPKLADCGFHVNKDVWFILIRNILRGEPSLLTGPSGTGKTELVELIAKTMEKELSIQDMGTVVDAQSSLLGVHRINSESKSEFEYAPFAEYIQKPSIILLDEINRASLSSNNYLFPVLDRRRYLPVDVASKEGLRRIPVHAECALIATANVGNEYSGTQAIDRALLDRFFPIELDYLKKKDEVKVLVERTSVDKDSAEAIVNVANQIRKQHKEQEISNAVSIRHCLQISSLVVDGFDLQKAFTSVLIPLFHDGIGVSERSKIFSIISAY